MSALGYKDKLILDVSNLTESDNVGAYVRANDGTLITYTTDNAKERLDVSTGAEHYENSAHTLGDDGEFVLAVRKDTPGTIATADGNYGPLQLDSSGNLRVTVSGSTTNPAVHAEGSAFTPGDFGSFSLTVRHDTLVTLDEAAGSYAEFSVDSRGALWVDAVGNVADNVADSDNPVKVGSKSVAGPLVAISAANNRANLISDKYRRIYTNDSGDIAVKNTNVTVGVAAATLLATASQLSGRVTYLIQNLGNKAIWLGNDATVTDANGFRVAAGATFSLDLGPDVQVFAISDGAGQDVRLFEIA